MEIALAIIHGAALPSGNEGGQFNLPISPLFLFSSTHLYTFEGWSVCVLPDPPQIHHHGRAGNHLSISDNASNRQFAQMAAKWMDDTADRCFYRCPDVPLFTVLFLLFAHLRDLGSTCV